MAQYIEKSIAKQIELWLPIYTDTTDILKRSERTVELLKIELDKMKKGKKYDLSSFEIIDSPKENSFPRMTSLDPVKGKRGRKKKVLDETTNIKKEKISEEFTVNKKADSEEMPAPKALPLRLKKIKVEGEVKSTKTKKSKASNKLEVPRNGSLGRESDVVLMKKSDVVLTVSDSEDSEKEVLQQAPVRSTRSKARIIAKKEVVEEEVQETRSTRTKTRAKAAAEKKLAEESVVEDSNKTKRLMQDEAPGATAKKTRSKSPDFKDALSNATFIAESKSNNVVNDTFLVSKPAANSTVIIEKPLNGTVIVEKPVNSTVILEKATVPQEPLMTDDESFEVPLSNIKSKNAPIFSPYEKTPLKKKIEAFERLVGKDSSHIPKPVKLPITPDTKHYTPLANRILPKMASAKNLRTIPSNSSKESLSTAPKSSSAMKASQAEYREREKRRQEKEAEASKKREALLHAQAEELRKKREEKQLKAQQAREAKEKEKQKLELEAQKMKNERYKQQIAEREEKQMRLKEESERKRLEAKKKAHEAKLKEQARQEEIQKDLEKNAAKNLEVQKMKQTRKLPIYMTEPAPLLPTTDCYDSDDEEYDQKKGKTPSWTQSGNLKLGQLVQIQLGDKLKNSFFSCKPQTPNLQAIFETIDTRKLKRTSSACWKKPPRFTMMQSFSERFDEESDED